MSTVLRTLLFCKIHTLKTLLLNLHEGSTFFHEDLFLTATRKSPSKQLLTTPVQDTGSSKPHLKQFPCTNATQKARGLSCSWDKAQGFIPP